MDQTKKTMRHFYCRDVLWETFEAMANDFDCSIDYLVNESMRLYARSKNYQVPAAGASPSQIIPTGAGGLGGGQSGTMNRPAIGTPSPSALGGGPSGAMNRPAIGTPSPSALGAGNQSGTMTRPALGTPSPSALRTTSTSQQMPRPITSPAAVPVPMPPPAPRPPAPMMATTPRATAAPPHTPATMPALSGTPAMSPATNLTPTSPVSNWSPPLATSAAAGGHDTGSALLYLVFNGQRHVVDKDQFVIGRGSKTADLPIKDGNISRQHAVVLRRNGVYYIKDLGSTNGIEYKGMRIDNKRIDEGDTFFICDYELKFTYQPQR